MRDSTEFRTTVRRGSRGASATLVAHVVAGRGSRSPSSVGFVVSKAVGSSVVRNRVKRRLRHLMRDRVELLPRGSRVVVRALPASASASSQTLASQLDQALVRSGAVAASDSSQR